MLTLAKYSVGVGDRFAHQAKAQLHAFEKAAEQGVEIVPVWNKSNREHTIIGTEPISVRVAADAAVRELGWAKPYHVDADHIQAKTVDRFIECSDFFTIDVADSIGQALDEETIRQFADRHTDLTGRVSIPRIDEPFTITRLDIEQTARKYLKAVREARTIYDLIAAKKGEGNFIAEISMDETDQPQTPTELLVILSAIADERLPIQTIAPKFTGRFNKGVEYVGNLQQFEKEFREDLAVVSYAIRIYGLPSSLKLSVHSGSDKFRLYPIMREAIRDFDTGLHLKTAGTNWLEEVIGLAEAGGDGLELAKEIYAKALRKKDELCAPYSTVIDIDTTQLPTAETVNGWTSSDFVHALRHDPSHPEYNPHLRQLLHVGFKVAAQMGDRYLNALQRHESIIARNVTCNLYDRHLKPLFIDGDRR